MTTSPAPGYAQYLWLSDLLKQLPGRSFETHRHPAVLLDLATGPSVRVWGWWTSGGAGRPAVPCVLWAGDLGWSVAVVEPDVFDTAGYERPFWSHRIRLLDLALANALGPFPTVEQLELEVGAESSLGPSRPRELTAGVLWGILQLEAARDPVGAVVRRLPVDGPAGAVDDELVAHDLSPAVAKPHGDHRSGVTALLEAVGTRHRRRHGWGLHGWMPGFHREGSRPQGPGQIA